MRRLFKIIEKPWVAWLAISAVVVSAVLVIRAFGWLQRSELFFRDRFIHSALNQKAEDDRIVIVGMTEDDLVKYGFPLDDEQMANLLVAIDAQNPVKIG